MTAPTTGLSNTAASSTIPATSVTAVSTGTSSGLSSVASALSSSAASAQSQASTGFSAQISAWISSVVDAIRSCLANLPLIGKFFAKEAATAASTTGASTTAPGTTVWTDAELVNMIKGQFVPAPATTSTTAPAVPAADVVQYCLNLFGQIGSPAAKIEAFQAVLTAVNSTDAIARDFYNALSGDQQTEFRNQIWIANCRNDNNLGMGFGQHMIDAAIRGPLAHQAVAAQLAALRAATSTTVASTTGGSTTGISTTGASTTGISTTAASTGP